MGIKGQYFPGQSIQYVEVINQDILFIQCMIDYCYFLVRSPHTFKLSDPPTFNMGYQHYVPIRP